MPDPTFEDALDWLAEREGKQVYVEVGMKDPTLDRHDFFPLAMWVTLGKVRLGSDEGHDRGLAFLPFRPFDPDERNRFYLDPARVTSIIINAAGLKITFHSAIYVGMTGD